MRAGWRAGWRIGWLAAALRDGGGSGLLIGISASHGCARKLRTVYFKIHFKLSELVAAR